MDSHSLDTSLTSHAYLAPYMRTPGQSSGSKGRWKCQRASKIIEYISTCTLELRLTAYKSLDYTPNHRHADSSAHLHDSLDLAFCHGMVAPEAQRPTQAPRGEPSSALLSSCSGLSNMLRRGTPCAQHPRLSGMLHLPYVFPKEGPVMTVHCSLLLPCMHHLQAH